MPATVRSARNTSPDPPAMETFPAFASLPRWAGVLTLLEAVVAAALLTLAALG